MISSAESYRFFSSSLLLMYDASPTIMPTTDALADEAIDVRMIDFAHSTYAGFLSDEAYNGLFDIKNDSTSICRCRQWISTRFAFAKINNRIDRTTIE